MKYKVGDKIRIKSIDWYNENKDEYGDVKFLIKEMSEFCGEIMTIKHISGIYYIMEESDIAYGWTDEMIEGLVEEKVDLIPKFGEYSDNEPLDIPTTKTEFIKEHGLPCPEDYIFKDENGNVINATKIVLEKKKKEYPKTYEECCEILGGVSAACWSGYKCCVLGAFNKLLICRDAYWKIAGEEMGLGKPWEPIWSIYEHKFCLGTDKDKIIEECVTTGNRILAFPTKEMRDAFYENFKELIESVKELL